LYLFLFLLLSLSVCPVGDPAHEGNLFEQMRNARDLSFSSSIYLALFISSCLFICTPLLLLASPFDSFPQLTRLSQERKRPFIDRASESFGWEEKVQCVSFCLSICWLEFLLALVAGYSFCQVPLRFSFSRCMPSFPLHSSGVIKPHVCLAAKAALWWFDWRH